MFNSATIHWDPENNHVVFLTLPSDMALNALLAAKEEEVTLAFPDETVSGTMSYAAGLASISPENAGNNNTVVVNTVRFWKLHAYYEGTTFVMWAPLHTMIGPIATALKLTGHYLHYDADKDLLVPSTRSDRVEFADGYRLLEKLLPEDANFHCL